MRCFLLSLLFATNALAQNIVPNGSFELYTALPTNTAQWNRVLDWDNISNDTACQTPDFFHAQAAATSGVQLPQTNYGNITAEDGDAVMGILTYLASAPEQREYISAPLTQPMLVGATYLVRFNAALGANPFHGGASSNLGVALSVGPFAQRCDSGASGVIPFSPQGENTSVVTSFGWELQSYTVVADYAYDRVTIGNFRDDANTAMQPIDSTLYTAGTYNGHHGGYYFIDNVSITKIADPNWTATVFANPFRLRQNPVDRFVEFDVASTKPIDVMLFNAQGHVVKSFRTNASSKEAAVEVSELPNGIYLVQIIDETLVTARFKVVVLH
jgi:hypothetical protein